MFKIRNYWPATLWATLILVLCGIPGKDLPEVGWANLVNLDKFIHAFIFLVLYLTIWLGGCARGITKNKILISALLICAAYGWATELLQQFVFQDRDADVMDFVANMIGSTIGMIIALFSPEDSWIKKVTS